MFCGLGLPLENQWWPSKDQFWGISSHFGLVLTYRRLGLPMGIHITDIYVPHKHTEI